MLGYSISRYRSLGWTWYVPCHLLNIVVSASSTHSRLTNHLRNISSLRTLLSLTESLALAFANQHILHDSSSTSISFDRLFTFKMYKPIWTTCTIAACLGGLTAAAENDTFGFLEMDLVFPRNDATYAPFSESYMPAIFAFQNFTDTLRLANAFRPRLSYSIWDRNNESNIVKKADFDLWGYLVSSYQPNKLWYEHHNIAGVEGTWQMNWTARWHTCEGGAENFTSTQSIVFSTKSSAGDFDLVAATNNQTRCAKADGMGVAWNISAMRGKPGDMCAEMSTQVATPTPCKIRVDPAEAGRIWRNAPETAPSARPTPSPEVQSGADKLFVGKTASWLALLVSLVLIMKN